MFLYERGSRLGRMLRLAAFKPFDSPVQFERAFQGLYLGQNLIVARRCHLFERRETAFDRVKTGTHVFLDGIQTGMHCTQFRR